MKSAVRCLNSKELSKVGLTELNVPLIGVLVECPFWSKRIHDNSINVELVFQLSEQYWVRL